MPADRLLTACAPPRTRSPVAGGSPTDSGDRCGWVCGGFLTSRLVLAFFKTSCVLVTETQKSPTRRRLPASGAHAGPGCVPQCVFQANSAWASCCPQAPHCSAFMLAQEAGASHQSPLPCPSQVRAESPSPLLPPATLPARPLPSRLRHPRWLKMNCSRLSFCRLAVLRRSAVLWRRLSCLESLVLSSRSSLVADSPWGRGTAGCRWSEAYTPHLVALTIQSRIP